MNAGVVRQTECEVPSGAATVRDCEIISARLCRIARGERLIYCGKHSRSKRAD